MLWIDASAVLVGGGGVMGDARMRDRAGRLCG